LTFDERDLNSLNTGQEMTYNNIMRVSHKSGASAPAKSEVKTKTGLG
jgi:hypothetical protein